MDILKQIVNKLKVDEDLIIVDKIFTAKGDTKTTVKALIYKKKDDIPKGKMEKMQKRMETKKKKPEEKNIEEVK
jgi:ribosomal protein S24E